MQVPVDKFVVTIDKYANTSAASIPMALVDSLESGMIKPDDTILLASFGAGLTWASAVVQLVPQEVGVSEERRVAEFAD